MRWIDDMIKKMQTKKHIFWVDEMKHGRPALEVLIRQAFMSEKDYSVCNMLRCIFKIRAHDSPIRIKIFFSAFSLDERIAVRSCALVLLIGIFRLEKVKFSEMSEIFKDVVRDSLLMGVRKDAEDVVTYYKTIEHV